MTIHQRMHGRPFDQRPPFNRRPIFNQRHPLLAATAGWRLFVVLAMAVGLTLVSPAARAVAATGGSFVPPLPPPFTVLHGFWLPSEPWLAGNRGVDLSATAGEPVLAVAAGTVLYAGMLAGRGVISISHGAIRTTYEPVDPVVRVGQVVTQGQVIGRLSDAADACGPPGSCLHWGAISATGYVDPMTFLGPPKVRLLPIWGNDLPHGATAIAAEPVLGWWHPPLVLMR